MRLFAIGDIHGCLTALQRLDQELKFQPDDTVITLGDYVDRGPDSKGVIDFLIQLRTRCRLIALRGNHEIMMFYARDDRAALPGWLMCGGDETLRSYHGGASDGIPVSHAEFLDSALPYAEAEERALKKPMSFDDVPAEHWQFLESTQSYHEEARDFFVHANAYSDYDLSAQPDYMLFWEHLRDATPHKSGRRMICGHTAQKSGLPLNLGHTVCIDTWAYGEGWLTCFEPATNKYWQASQRGGFREGALG